MSAAPARLDRHEVARLLARTDLSTLVGSATTLKRAGRGELRGPCPWCDGGAKRGSTKFRVNDGRFRCFLCDRNGDAIGWLEQWEGLDFRAAVERLGGPKASAPGVLDRDAWRPAAEAAAAVRDAAAEEAEKKRAREADERERRAAETLERLLKIWRGAERDGVGVARYLRGRAIRLAPPASLRFVPALPYWGFVDGVAERRENLGAFPAIVGLIQAPDGAALGLHRTWLDPETFTKLRPPGDPNRNGAKKILGRHWGGAIRLTGPGETLIVGEGYETTLTVVAALDPSEFRIGRFAAWSAVSLGNLAGSASGPSRPHPDDPKKSVPSAWPDPERPGLLPPDWAASGLFLGDGDSDPYVTRARLACAERRWRATGRPVRVAWAAAGQDFNDMAQAEEREAEHA